MGQKKPDKVFRIGYVSASIFVNEVGPDEDSRKMHSVVVQKRYMDGKEAKYTSSFGLAELPLAARVLQLAQQYVEEQEAEVSLGD